MTYDPTYYTNRKQELNQENFKNIIEGYQDIERVVLKNLQKAKELQAKFQELEVKEKASQEQTKKDSPKEEPKKASK